jgi:hypothetical protein
VLSASGLPTNGFVFAGFLPPKSAARIAFFTKYRDCEFTLALYESCHRIDKAVAEVVATLGPDRVICVAKEVTKLHEAFLTGRSAEVQARLAKTVAFVNSFTPAHIDGTEDKAIVTKRGDTETHYTGMQFLLGHALPNIYFHSSMVYAILRHNGVEIGKRDYLGKP